MTSSRTFIIKYQIPGITTHGELLEQTTFDFADAAFEIAITVETPHSLQPASIERIASAARVRARELGIRRRMLGLHLHFPNHTRPFSLTHCSTSGETVVEMSLTTAWRHTLTFELLRAQDILDGRFPSMHPSAQVPWLDLLWSMSLTGRVEKRLPPRIDNDQTDLRNRSSRVDGDIRKDRAELINALIWKAKQEGLSLTRSDGEMIAHRLWGTAPTLKDLADLGRRYGLHLQGPLASTPLTQTWRVRRAKSAATLVGQS